jgi:hypothetical protein
MTFYGQLDSIVSIAEVGLVHVFLCFNDFQARAVVQSGSPAGENASVDKQYLGYRIRTAC